MRINKQTVEHSFLPRDIRTEVLKRYFASTD
jgi:hypothetical protein